MPRLAEIASVVRSKNAGPLFLTFDVMFEDEDAFRLVIGSRVLNPEAISRLFHVPATAVEIAESIQARALKITIPRRLVAGNLGETDMYGTQQYVPLLDLEIPRA